MLFYTGAWQSVVHNIYYTGFLNCSASSLNWLRDQVSHYAESGARLVCAEAVGYVRSSSANEQYTSKL